MDSPAATVRYMLALLLKERYGEDLPEDIEAARAWWKANEQRFADKDDNTAKKSRSDPQREPMIGSQGTLTAANKSGRVNPTSGSGDAQSTSGESESEPRLLTIAAILVALLGALAVFLFRKR